MHLPNNEDIKAQIEHLDQVKDALLKYRNEFIEERYNDWPYHFTPTKDAILKIVYDKKSCVINEITKSLSLSPGAITLVLNQLEEEALIVRIRKPNNRRSVWVELTDKGRIVVEAINETRLSFWGNLLGNLSEEEQNEYFRLMKKMQEGLQKI